MKSLRQRTCARIPAFASVAVLLALVGSANADVTLLDFFWTSSANTGQIVQATCDDACPGGMGICTASVPSFFQSGASMSQVDGTYSAGRSCANGCGDSLYMSATSGVGTYIAIKPPLIAGQTQLWSFAHSIATGAEAMLSDGGCGAGNASAGTSAHHDWNLTFRVDALTELTMNYAHSAIREGGGVGPTSSWTLRDANGASLFEQHLGGQFGLPSDQGTLTFNLEPGDYTMRINSDVEGLALANGPVASHSASANCEMVFRPFQCAHIVAQTLDQTISRNDDLTLGVIIEPAMLGRHYHWQLQSPIPPYAWNDVTDGTFFRPGIDLIIPIGEVNGATTDTMFLDLDPQYAELLSGSLFRCLIEDECGLNISRPIQITVIDGASACPACPADFDQDGGVTGNDLVAFFDAWQIGGECADLDADGGVTASDLGAFFTAYEVGGC